MGLRATHFPRSSPGHPSMAKTVTVISICCNLRGPPVLINPALHDGEDPRIDGWIAGRN
jgi:hypothetical protein